MTTSRGLILLAFAALTAHAGPILWTLNGVTGFGSSLTGSFVYNADTNVYSTINITSNGAGGLPADSFTVQTGTPLFNATLISLVDTSAIDQTGARILQVGFANPLTNLGGSDAITFMDSGICFNSGCSQIFTSTYIQTTGTGTVNAAISTPEPSTFLLIGSMLTLGAVRKRRSFLKPLLALVHRS
jgi:hypothetical protein